MTSPREHWFAIEQVMSGIHARLEQARAAVQLPPGATSTALVDRAAPPAALAALPTAGQPQPPEGRPSSPAHALINLAAQQTLEPLFGRPLAPSEATGHLVASDAWAQPREAAADIVALRTQIRERLTWLRAQLGNDLSAREAYHVLFPLVIHIDELTAVALGPRASDWRPLQIEFFDIDDGGEQFFQTASELLAKDDTHPLVFEVYLFCLNDGFVGRFGGSTTKLHDYKINLAARIPTSPPPVMMAADETNQVELVDFPRRYYMLSAASVATVFVLLHLLSLLEVGAG